MIVGSSGVLAVDTTGFSTARTDRDVRVAVVDDADAFLGLTEDGVEDGGLLFGGEPRRPPVSFDVINQLPEPIVVTLAVDTFRFDSADGVDVSDDRVVVGADGDRLGAGERLEDVTVNLDPGGERPPGPTVTGTIEIDASGDGTRIEAERDLVLEWPEIDVDAATVDVRQTGGGVFEHEWRLRTVDVDGTALERLRFDYSDVETAPALDFTAADGLSVSVTVDGDERATTGSIERRAATALDVALEPPLEPDAATIEVVLTDTGPPASPGGGNGDRAGATVELDGDTVSERVEASWRRG